jgi:SAM-dependent methyltransferase
MSTDPTPPGPRSDPADRFSERANDYVRGRPGYPEALFDALIELGRLEPGATIADLGAGTGISSEPLLRRGFRVVAVEPNQAMRAALAEQLASRSGLVIVSGSAEETGLARRSIDLALAAQAFHWFDAERSKSELRRILSSPESRVALVWNARRALGTPFVEAYEQLLLRHGTDYKEVGHRGVGRERLASFFGGAFDERRFDNVQRLDFPGLSARLLSSSYVPAAGQSGHEEMMAALGELFAAHQADGAVELLYDCELSIGALAPAEPA